VGRRKRRPGTARTGKQGTGRVTPRPPKSVTPSFTSARHLAEREWRAATEAVGSRPAQTPQHFRFTPGRIDRGSAFVFPIQRRHRLRWDPSERAVRRATRDGLRVNESSVGVQGLVRLRTDLESVGPLYFSGQNGTVELKSLYDELRLLARRILERHSAAEWLGLLRRCHWVRLDAVNLAPGFFVDRLIRESPRSTPSFDSEAGVRDTDGFDLAELLLVASAMWQVGRCYRTVAKGLVAWMIGSEKPPLQKLSFVSVGVAADPRLREGIILYDSRNFGGFGSKHGAQGSARQTEASEKVLSFVDSVVPGWSNCEYSANYGPRRTMMLSSHIIHVLGNDSVFAPFPGAPAPSHSSLAAAAILWTCFRAIQGGRKRFLMPRGSWMKWGYCDVTRQVVDEGLRRWQSVATQYAPDWRVEDVFGLLTTSTEDAWSVPYPAVLLPLGGDLYRFDLFQATEAVNTALLRSIDGSAANDWADNFEDEVQSIIDQSPWCPPSVVRDLKGRKVRRNGQPFTDLDAVGFRNGQLLLIDAKSWVTSTKFEYGDFSAVRNLRGKVEEAEREWRTKTTVIGAELSLLRLTREMVTDVVGLVVCPDVPWVLPGPCTEMVFPPMRRVGTLRELEMALNDGRTRIRRGPGPAQAKRRRIDSTGPA
jgi:hypothetical protein